MEELMKDVHQLNVFQEDNQLVPNHNPLVNLKFTKKCVKKCWNLILLCSVHLCLFPPVVGAEVSNTTVVVNMGDKIALPCTTTHTTSQLSWRHPGKMNTTGSLVKKQSGALVIMNTSLSDAGMYYCMSGDQTVAQVQLKVYDVPSRINKILVSTNSVYSIVSWSAPADGGHPILGYICQHRPDSSSQENGGYSEENRTADSLTCDLYNLVPNTTYYIRVAAFNKLGMGEFNSQMTTTKPINTVLLGTLPESLQGSQSGYGRVLAMSIAVSVIALATLGSGIALLMIRHRGQAQPIRPLQESPGEDESLELVPHITLNPSFNIDMLEHIAPDLNENSEHAFLVGSPTGRER